MSESQAIFGIDLGTTYSAIAYVDEFGMPRVLMNQENTAVTPSVVYFNNPTDVLVGLPAREAGRIDPQNYVELIKRAMGSDHLRFIHGEEFRPEQLSALILKKLKRDAETLVGTEVKSVVSTVPAYFNEAQRMATEQAGAIAGLDVRGIIPEPVAAAVAYAAANSGTRTLLVYDLGGGTFDVTVIRVEGDKVRVLCVGGDHDLGGRNWDEKLVIQFAERWRAETGSYDDPLADMETQQELFKQAEEIKRLLTHRPKAPIRVSHAGQNTRLELTRDEFDAMTRDLLERTITLTRQTVDEAAAAGSGPIDKILLVGGSCYMPQVQDRLKAEFPSVEQQLFEPEQAVAKGAAIYAASKEVADVWGGAPGGQAEDDGGIRRRPRHLGGSIGGPLVVVNVCSRNYGVEALDENDKPVVDYLIARNSAVPATQENTYATRHPNQQDILIKVYETDGPSPSEDPLHPSCRVIKQVTLNLPPNLSADHPILVRFSLSEDGGRLRVEARDPHSGLAVDDAVETVGGIKPGDIGGMRDGLSGINLG